jgi:transposase-like protein
MTRTITSAASPITCPGCASRKVRCLLYRDGPWLDVITVYECQSCRETFEVSPEIRPPSKRGVERHHP